MEPTATIKLFLPHGDPKRLRTAQISNWTGQTIAAPRTEIEALLKRDELKKTGVYLLLGTHPDSGEPHAYVGEGEVLRKRVKQHKNLEFWVSAIVFASSDDSLTKSHVKYLEGRLIEEAKKAGRYTLENSQSSGARLPESDEADMEVFLARIRQALPVLGSDLLIPIAGSRAPGKGQSVLYCKNKGAAAKGARTETGFVIYKDSTAVLKLRPSARTHGVWVINLRNKLIENGTLVKQGNYYTFTRDSEFSSPSAAAAIIHGGHARGPIEWKTAAGKTLKQLEEK